MDDRASRGPRCAVGAARQSTTKDLGVGGRGPAPGGLRRPLGLPVRGDGLGAEGREGGFRHTQL